MDKNTEANNERKNKASQPDKQTLHKTDPQENMEGPMSSPTKVTGEVFDTDESKENADERREERM